MATTLVYSNSAFVPFTKISSSVMNTYFADIRSRINWAGSTDATTGLGDDNLQSNTASGGGLTRATKLKLGTANAFISNSSTGAMQDVVSAANQTLYTNASGVPTAGPLPLAAGGVGSSLTIGNPDEVLKVNSGGTALVFAVTPVPPSIRPQLFLQFS